MSTPPPVQFRSQNEMIEYLSALERRVTELEFENEQQRGLIQSLDVKPAPAVEPLLPRTNLLHPSFLTRAFAVWGHYFVAQFIIAIGITIILLILTLAGVTATGLVGR